MIHPESLHLAEEPFHPIPDARFFHSCPEHASCLDACRAAMTRKAGVALVTAGRGMGKSLLSLALARELSSKGVRTLRISAARGATDTLAQVLELLEGGQACQPSPMRTDEAAIEDEAGATGSPAQRILKRLAELEAQGMKAVLAVDDAHGLTSSGATEGGAASGLDRLLDLCAPGLEGLPHLTLVLLAADGLEGALVHAMERRGMGRPVTIGFRRLSASSVKALLRYRMDVAGNAGAIDQDALKELSRTSSTAGNPLTACLAAAECLRRAEAEGVSHAETRHAQASIARLLETADLRPGAIRLDGEDLDGTLDRRMASLAVE